ncbi:hypothetical protein DPMN_170058 [Dreissena polymorpha]|uniref:Uncharacterized protein n=1 Tax=Dreissena polymorpha TaxID=45954 RepID=A0A9D4DZ29_DREPO|nr:hypothetical protein DPMN_170058 [Dreissena polymorpha]
MDVAEQSRHRCQILRELRVINSLMAKADVLKSRKGNEKKQAIRNQSQQDEKTVVE